MRTKIIYILPTAVLSALVAFLVRSREPGPDKMTPSVLTAAKLKRIHIQLLTFYSANHRWPTPSHWKEDLKPYLEADGTFPFGSITVDSWGTPIQCVENTNASGLVLYSFGKNGIDEHGSNDDIAVFAEKPK